jgi:hypothetical protein
MPLVTLPQDVVKDLCRYLGAAVPAQQVDRAILTKRGFLPRKFEWNPDVCLLHDNSAYMICSVVDAELPQWVTKPVKRLTGKFRRSRLVVLIRSGGDAPSWKVASQLADECVQLGAGLAVEIFNGCCLVFPPDLIPPKKHTSRIEAGHIPSWVLDRLTACGGFSKYLAKTFRRFITKYRKATLRSAPSYDEESELLLEFVRELRKGDTRVFLPLGLLTTLAEWERQRKQGDSRDHFFHTFNNLFLGFLILSELFATRGTAASPDRYIRQKAGDSTLLPWEIIWVLTCLFHDPGYIGEKIWLTISFAYGLPNQLPSDQPIPEQIREQLNNAWDVDHKQIGEDIVSLFQRLVRSEDWVPPRLINTEAASFQSALRKTYFDGVRVGHSLQSGIRLINYCEMDPTPHPAGYDRKVALIACEIAALSMMFHDQHCRKVMRESHIQPLTFEQLPYSAVLMFVDALQDDRRDITENRFNEHGVLEDLGIYQDGEHRVVRARVCLQEVPLKYWASKVEEYEDVMRWINANSETQFTIDYRTRAWKQRAHGRAPRGAKPR